MAKNLCYTVQFSELTATVAFRIRWPTDKQLLGYTLVHWIKMDHFSIPVYGRHVTFIAPAI